MANTMENSISLDDSFLTNRLKYAKAIEQHRLNVLLQKTRPNTNISLIRTVQFQTMRSTDVYLIMASCTFLRSSHTDTINT